MKSIYRYLVLSVYGMLITGYLYSQILESEWSAVVINNKPQIKIKDTDSLPPVISMITPLSRENEQIKTNDKKLTIIGKVTDNENVKSLIINSNDILPNTSGIFTDDILLDEGVNLITIVAMDMGMNISEKRIFVKYTAAGEFNDSIEIHGKYYALLVAVNEYKSPELFNLENPVNDALALKSVLSSRYNFNEEDILFLEDPTMESILGAFDNLSRKLTKDDNLFIFYAGHGWWDSESCTGFWLPSDADRISRTRWIRNSTVQDFMKEIKSKHTLLITDACFSGSIFVSRSINLNASTAVKKLYEMPSRKAMTSGSLTEVPDQSIFVKYLIDKLKKNEDKYLSAEQLFSSFRIAVINNSDVLPQYGVIKNTGDEGGEFIFILKQE